MNTRWGVYGFQGKTSTGKVVDERDKAATKWFIRWRVNGHLRKRTFTAKGYARTFRDELTKAQLLGWDADDHGWPIDPHRTHPTPTPEPTPPSVEVFGLTVQEYCENVWWPTMGSTFNDKNRLGHRKNMRDAIDLLVYPETDHRLHTGTPRQPGQSILLADLLTDDVTRALVQRRTINGRTKAVNQRRINTAIAAGLDPSQIDLDHEIASPSTVRAFKITLAMFIRAAMSSGHTTGDPLHGSDRLAPAPKPTSMSQRIVPSIGEIFDLADAIAALGPIQGGRPLGDRYRSLILVAGTLGPRPGELVAHQPDWINWDNPTTVRFQGTEAAVYDPETGVRGNQTRPLKHRAEGDYREVPAIDAVADALRDHLDLGYATRYRTWTSPSGRAHLNWGNLTDTYWRPACQKVFAGTDKNILATMPPKTLRKAAITLWLDSGINPLLAAEWAGHTPDIANRFYASRSTTTYTTEINQLRQHLNQR